MRNELIFSLDCVDPSAKYVGNLEGQIDILTPGAKPIARIPAPIEFDDLGRPVWGEGPAGVERYYGWALIYI